MKKILIYLLPIMAISLLQSCSKEDDDDNNGSGGSSNKTAIYYRWTDDIDYVAPGATCGLEGKITNYVDDNPKVPSNASRNQFYGPVDEGSYYGTFRFGNDPSAQSVVEYTLEAPPAGYARYYTKKLADFNEPLYRCVIIGLENYGLSYYDEPCGSNCGQQLGGGGGGGGGTGNCSGSYQSPTPNDAQLDALCQAAYTYRCGGYDSQADLTCAQYQQLAATGTNVPRCSYCN